MGRKLDLTGQTFNELTAIKEVPTPKGRKKGVYWLCKCSCGNEIIVPTSHLRTGHTKSCGCKKNDYLREKKTKRNVYDLTGEYGICYASNTNEPILFDLEDYDKIKDYCWLVVRKRPNSKYRRVQAGCGHGRGNRSIVKMHRLILGDNDLGLVTDHINGNTLDNRKENLRFCTIEENNRNLRAKHDGYKGVQKEKKKWVANIVVDHVKHRIGLFNTPEEAALAYNEAALKYHGEFASLNDVHFDNGINTIAD